MTDGDLNRVSNPAFAAQPDDGWDCGWEEHKKRQLRRLARLAFSEKLKWLEEAQQLVEAIRAQRNRSVDPSTRAIDLP
jgi:hypothetical protein